MNLGTLKKLTNQQMQHKDKLKSTQLKTIFEFLSKWVATGSMVAQATGIPQKNFCRFKRDLEKSGHLAEVKKGFCDVTGHRAWFVNTNPKLFPSKKQLNLFQWPISKQRLVFI